MYIIKQHPILSYKYIHSLISDYDIYTHYLGYNFKVGEAFNSPLRKDNNPSFSIFKSKRGELLYKDFGSGETGNVISFVQIKMNLPNYQSALVQIYCDLIWNKKGKVEGVKEVTKQIKTTKADIGIKRQNFTQIDYNYWNQYGITLKILKHFDVYPIKYVFKGPYIHWEYTKDSPMYAYKVYDKFKIYRPLETSNKSKWYGSLTREYLQGYKQLPNKGDLLIITKSMKDVMCLYSFGYIAIAPSSESTLIPENIINNLKKRFNNIILFYDNDESGKLYSDRMSKKYELNKIEIPIEKKAKDISDYYKLYGKQNSKELLGKLIPSNEKEE